MIGLPFRLLTAVSWLLLIAVAGMWVRGYFKGDQLQMQVGAGVSQRDFAVRSTRGKIQLFYSRVARPVQSATPSAAGSSYWPVEFTYSPIEEQERITITGKIGNVKEIAELKQIGFAVRKQEWGTPPAPVLLSWEIASPSWFAAGVFAVMPVLAYLKRRVFRTRKSTGKCVQCGYDLRGSQARCPECGLSKGTVSNMRPL